MIREMIGVLSLFETYTYLLAGVAFFALWIILFIILFRTNRLPMLGFSFAAMILGYIVQKMHLVDWWQPAFLYPGLITLEDTLFGFAIGGVVYATHTLVNQQLPNVECPHFSVQSKLIIGLFATATLLGLFYGLGLHSFWASVISLAIPITVIGWSEFKLLLPTFITSCLITIVAVYGYLLGIYLNPTFVADTYLFEYLSGILVLGIPIEELLWFFIASFGLSATIFILED